LELLLRLFIVFGMCQRGEGKKVEKAIKRPEDKSKEIREPNTLRLMLHSAIPDCDSMT
jgi:hypothetical protein